MKSLIIVAVCLLLLTACKKKNNGNNTGGNTNPAVSINTMSLQIDGKTYKENGYQYLNPNKKNGDNDIFIVQDKKTWGVKIDKLVVRGDNPNLSFEFEIETDYGNSNGIGDFLIKAEIPYSGFTWIGNSNPANVYIITSGVVSITKNDNVAVIGTIKMHVEDPNTQKRFPSLDITGSFNFTDIQ